MTSPRIALIHATPVAIEPIRDALSSGWPEADVVNILEDSLSPDRASSKELTPELYERISDLGRYARKIGSDGILFTCSAFGAAIEQTAASLDIPVLKPNEAMFEEAIKAGRNNAMIATFAPAKAGMEAEFAEEAARLDPHARLTSYVVEQAMTALRSGDVDTHNRLIAEQAAALEGYDAIVLAHFSTARAAATVREAVSIPVLTSPDAAVRKLRRLLRADKAASCSLV
jgi:aspartate/glutamate racemase